jgi:hypothetical protein
MGLNFYYFTETLFFAISILGWYVIPNLQYNRFRPAFLYIKL